MYILHVHLTLMLRCQCLSVRLSVMEVHWRIVANLGFKFRCTFTVLHIVVAVHAMPGREEGSSRAILATARPSCWYLVWMRRPICGGPPSWIRRSYFWMTNEEYLVAFIIKLHIWLENAYSCHFGVLW